MTRGQSGEDGKELRLYPMPGVGSSSQVWDAPRMNPENWASHRLWNLGSLELLDSAARSLAIEAGYTLTTWQERNLLLGRLSFAHCPFLAA